MSLSFGVIYKSSTGELALPKESVRNNYLSILWCLLFHDLAGIYCFEQVNLLG
jgi:hypothetical protein